MLELRIKDYANMRTAKLAVCIVFTLACMKMPCYGKDYSDPTRFEKAIRNFEAADKEQAPPQAAILCVGSSSIRGWHDTVHEDLAPLTIIPRGFGGSNMNDLLYYADRIVLPYKPRAIVVYEGDNDLAQGISPQKFVGTFRKFVDKVHKQFPECRIYFLSIKPSIRRWHLWSEMKEANRIIAAECSEDKRLSYVDVASGMLDDQGKPRDNIFQKDDLHMTRGGYVIWRDKLRPILIQSELQYEEQKPAEILKLPAGLNPEPAVAE